VTLTLPSTDRQAWLADRRSGIGGSDAVAVMGVSKWRTPYEVYLAKRGEGREVDVSPAMHWGNRLEPVIREEYSNATGRVVKVPTTILRHPAHDWMIGSIDGVTEDNRLLEIKTTRSAEGWGDEGTDDIPEAYLVQVQHYLTVTGLSIADVAVLIGGSDFRLYEVAADPELQAILTQVEQAFWTRVCRGEPPDPVSLSDARVRWGRSTAREVEADDAVREWVKALAQNKAALARLEETVETLQAGICAAMADADTLTADGKTLATWKSAKPASRFDTTAFKLAHPDLYSHFTKQGEPTRRFLLKDTK
jgi:putative phage-type endonuclease